MEINLLKKLKHKNIVKYVDHYHKSSTLFIIMEYVRKRVVVSIDNCFGSLEAKTKTIINRVTTTLILF